MAVVADYGSVDHTVAISIRLAFVVDLCREEILYFVDIIYMINHSHTIVQLSSDTTVSMMLPIGYRLLLYTQQVSLKVDMFKAAKVQGVLVPYIAGLTIQTPPFWPP